MWVVEGVVAGVLAGIFMGIASEIGYRFNVVKSHLIVIDGAFALRLLQREDNRFATYVLGIFIHLITSVIFGVIYVIIARLLDFDTRLVAAIVPYVVFLWLAMLLAALPIAGQGIMGRKIGRTVIAEQLVLHIIFGIGFWWALGLLS